MKLETVFSAFADRANVLWAAAVAGLVAVFGEKWYLFGFFLLLNLVDFAYGCLKSWKTHTTSSAKGARGIVKKISYWVVIALAFAVGRFCSSLGEELGIQLHFLELLGWFTLAVYILNELTSIVENLMLLGVQVPDVLVRGLQAAHKIVDEAGDRTLPTQQNNKEEP